MAFTAGSNPAAPDRTYHSGESTMKKILLALAVLAGVSQAMPAASRVTLPSGKKIFVSGMNLAWIHYANDVVSFSSADSTSLEKAMKDVHDSGGNAMRIWLSTDGTKDPVFANGLVSGPSTQTIANIQKMLKIAKHNNLVLILSLMSHNWMNTANLSASEITRNKAMLQTDAGIAAYVDNYVVPVTKAIGVDPNILCWEVFNEPEGMVQGWEGLSPGITMANVQMVVNRVAAAIHRNVPGVLVSNGAVVMSYTSSVGGTNYYTDAALKSVGGDSLGYLDFYMAHYYGNNGTANSPFTKKYSYWNLDKPLVIGEYPSSDWTLGGSNGNQDAGKVDTLLTYLDNSGYAGGLGWMYYSNAGMSGFSTFGHSMRALYRNDSASISLTGNSDHKFVVIADASNGGSVTTSRTGRIDSGAVDTITAIAATGYTFSGWTGDTTATGAKLAVTVTRDRQIKANFVANAGTNLIKNGDFATGSANWGSLNLASGTGAAASVDFASGKAVVTITGAGTLGWHIQLSQSGIAFDSGVTYILTFDASSTAARSMNVDFSYGASADTSLNWKWLGGSTVALTSVTTNFSVEVTPFVAAPSGVLQLGLGGSTSSVTIDNVTLVKKVTSLTPRSILHSDIPTWSLRRSGADLVWTRSQAIQAGGVVRLVGVDGRELSRASVRPGAVLGSLKAPASGIAFLVLESADVREIQALPLAR
jgi:uncharacterized repeat protein (TIGR02543 family)